MSLFTFKYFKPPSINASSINICEKKQKQQQKRMGQDRAERIVDLERCVKEKRRMSRRKNMNQECFNEKH